MEIRWRFLLCNGRLGDDRYKLNASNESPRNNYKQF